MTAKKTKKTGKNKKPAVGRARKSRLLAYSVAMIVLAAVLATSFLFGTSQREKDANKVLRAVVEGDNVLLDKVVRMDYREMSRELEIKSLVAIYFEDEQANLVEINGQVCFGSPEIKVKGVPCKG